MKPSNKIQRKIRQFNPQQWAAFNSQAGQQPWGVAQRAIDASDWRLRTWAGSLWPAIRPIWRSTIVGAFWDTTQDGGAQPQGWKQQQQPQWGGQQQRQLRNRISARWYRQLCRPASDPGSGTAAASGQPVTRLRPNAAHAEPAGCQRSGEADPADRAQIVGMLQPAHYNMRLCMAAKA